MQESSLDKSRKRILRISIITTIVLIASVIWVNYQRNALGDKTLTFENEAMPAVFKKIEETYLSDVLIQDDSLKDCKLTASYKDKTLEEVLGNLAYRYKFKLEKINPRKYEVSGGQCRK